MSIQFRCPKCEKKLSIGSRKAGTQVACPSCRTSVTVPADPSPIAEPESERRFPLVAVSVAIVLVAFGAATAFLFRKPANIEQARVDPPPASTPTPAPTPPVVPQSNPSRPQQNPQQKQQGFEIGPEPRPQNSQQQPTSQPTPQPTPTQQPEPTSEAPPPRLVVVKPPPPQVPDRFGNPVGDQGLGRDGEFKGKKLLFWSGFEAGGRVFFGPTNPLWKALETQGFTVRREFGRFKPEWLKDVDQLWILSTGKLALPEGITPDLLELALQFLPAEEVPSGFTLEEYRFVVRATFDCVLSPIHPLDEKSFKAIEDFVKAGKGLCLLADDEPFCFEANELARRLFGSGVSGNYRADQVAHVSGHGLTPADIRKFGGKFEVDHHPLLTGVNFLFEGITVSNISASDKLETVLKASDGKTLIAVSKVAGQRVVIDCGFTRYCHGPDPKVSYILKTAGTVRLGQNIAAYLAGKDK